MISIVCCLFLVLLHLTQALPAANGGPQPSSPPPPYRGDEAPQCTEENILVRKEWSRLSPAERISYSDSVNCLLRKPSRLPAGLAPGARSRYDDFTATHINLTYFIHADGQFLSWHRHFVWLYESALRDECGYRGAQPFWDWSLHAHNMSANPIFDGSATSLSGDGVYDPASERIFNGNYTFPHGTGGGCVATGPFANRTLPFQRFPIDGIERFQGELPADALEYRPHCFTRDLNSFILRHNSNATVVDYLLRRSPDIKDWQDSLDFGVTGTPTAGAHGGGHRSVGLDLGDIFASPSDPVFFLHHGFIDLLWSGWQARDPRRRQYALSGGSTLADRPPTADVTVEFEMDFGQLAPPTKIGAVMDVRKGRYCYRYEYPF